MSWMRCKDVQLSRFFPTVLGGVVIALFYVASEFIT